jgi:hypothetical protein
VYSTRILMPGWQTLAAFHPHIDPRVVECEHRERRIAGRETLTQDPSKNATQDPAMLALPFPRPSLGPRLP